MMYIFNTLITPINFDEQDKVTVEFKKVTVEEAKELIRSKSFDSVIGHEATAQVLSMLLGLEIPFQRKTVFMKIGDEGLHFFLKQRLPEGQILNKEQLEQLDFWLVYSKIKEG